jgi:regulator of protease activity HflC (stomatin/prohibitin superfamily)
VYVYSFEWNETLTGEDGKEKIFGRDEPSDFIYVSDFTYAIKTDGAETKDLLPTDELTLVTLAIRNPYRALFSGQDWMKRVTSTINRQVRTFVGTKDYDTLVSSEDTAEEGDAEKKLEKWASEFSLPIIDLNNLLHDETEESPLPRGLNGRYGIEIRTADLQTVELSGTPETKQSLLESSTKRYTAGKEAEATRIKGQAGADVIEMEGKKKASSLKERLKVIKNFGEIGTLLAQADAAQTAANGTGNTVLWANNPFVPLLSKLLNETKEDKE